jgi:hypothetical protein
MTKKVAPKRTKGPRQASRARPPGKSPLEPLAMELYGVMRGALTKYGLNTAAQRRLFSRAQRASKVTRVSDSLLHQFRGLGDLISTWREEPPYVDEIGKPRVLDIEGPGATFASLARKFLPAKSVAEVVALACRTASVGTLAGERIALYGDTLVDLSRNREGALAQTICHITRIFDTCLHNVRRAHDDAVVGRLERLVNQVISAEDFEKFQRAIRPQLHDTCERVDRLLQSSTRKGSVKGQKVAAAGMGVYLYYDGAVKHVRHGGGDTDS